MKIVIAPDSFKGSATSAEVAKNIESGVRKVFPDANIVKIPIADGGEGTVEAFVLSAGGNIYVKTVTGPMGNQVEAAYGILSNGTAVIEMAAAAGLSLAAENERDPLKATTYGVGELILEALDKGCKTIIIGLGGSATNDGGKGMARAVGVVFNEDDVDLSGIDPRTAETEIILASDVSSPLCGPNGASFVFGPQKGADPETVKILDESLKHFSELVRNKTGLDFADVPGAGAAGGLGYGLMVFCGAIMKPGIETIMDSVNFDGHLRGCDLVITGEGRIDGQSVFGKVPVGVAGRAAKYRVPVLAIVGGIGDGAEAVYDYGIDSIMSIVNKPMPLDEAVASSAALLAESAERAMRILKMGIEMKAQ